MEYYISINNEKRGPYTLEELRVRNISAETLVSTDGSQWIPAWQLNELREIIEQQNTTVSEAKETEKDVPISPAQPVMEPERNAYANQQAQEPYRRAPEQKRRSFGGCLLALLITTIIAVAFVFTCPDQQAHKDRLTTLMSNAMQEVMEKNIPADGDLMAKGIQMVGGILMNKVVDTAVDNMLTVDNYVVCSLGKVRYDGKDHIVSVGLLGHIFTVNQEEVTKATEKYYLDFHHDAENSIKDQIKQNVVDPIKDALQDALGGLVGGMLDDDATDITPNEDSTDSNSENESEY